MYLSGTPCYYCFYLFVLFCVYSDLFIFIRALEKGVAVEGTHLRCFLSSASSTHHRPPEACRLFREKMCRCSSTPVGALAPPPPPPRALSAPVVGRVASPPRAASSWNRSRSRATSSTLPAILPPPFLFFLLFSRSGVVVLEREKHAEATGRRQEEAQQERRASHGLFSSFLVYKTENPLRFRNGFLRLCMISDWMILHLECAVWTTTGRGCRRTTSPRSSCSGRRHAISEESTRSLMTNDCGRTWSGTPGRPRFRVGK